MVGTCPLGLLREQSLQSKAASSSVWRSPLALLFPLLLFTASMFISVSADKNHWPGFAYSRARGKCTASYWSSRSELWPRMVPHTSTVSKVFGSRAFERYRSDQTLLEATARNEEEEEGSSFDRLLKQATAALLNSYAREAFPYSSWQVKTLLIQALVSEQAAAAQTQRFYLANEACNE